MRSRLPYRDAIALSETLGHEGRYPHHMVDVTDATFEQAVLERSKVVPVVVDLWATWCGPCETLGPMLEAAVAARGGTVELAKVDVDANPSIAQMFQVQSIPAVFAIKDTKVIDGFVGGQGAAEIEEFLDRIAPAPSEVDLLVSAGDETSLRKAWGLEPGNTNVIAALAGVLVATHRPGEALELLAKIPETTETRALMAEARLAEQAIDVQGQEVGPLLDALLEKVSTDEEARQEYLDLLETLGPTNPLAVSYRKALATRLF
jgi:putative thioredoxin